MSNPNPNKITPRQTTLSPAQGRGTLLSTLPRPVLVGGGLAVGTVGLVAAGAVLVAALHLVVTLITLLALGAVVVAFWIFWPSFVYALQVGRLKAENAVTTANPLEALQMERDRFAGQISDAGQQLARANGEMENMRRQFGRTQADLAPEQIITWKQRIAQREATYGQAQGRLSEMKEKLADFDRQLRGARAEMGMAAADDALGASLSASNAPELSSRSQLAFESISREIGRSSAMLDQALQAVER